MEKSIEFETKAKNKKQVSYTVKYPLGQQLSKFAEQAKHVDFQFLEMSANFD